MCHQKAVMLLLSITSLLSIYHLSASAKTHSMSSNDDVSDLSKGLTSFPALTVRTTKVTSMTLSKQEEKYKHETLVPSNQRHEKYEDIHPLSYNQRFREHRDRDASLDFAESDSSFNQDLSSPNFSPDPEKRNVIDDDSKRKSTLKGKQKKAKALGRLLMNSVSTKNYNDIQDDYIEDEDDDYSKGVNGEKMNWEDYQNEDGASVMELIALNARHKTNMQRARWNEYLY